MLTLKHGKCLLATSFGSPTPQHTTQGFGSNFDHIFEEQSWHLPFTLRTSPMNEKSFVME
jgi:hypothetical protein